MSNIIAFSGSSRRNSYNTAVLRIAIAAAEAAGATVTLFDLRELDMPIFDQDLEAEKGLPPGAVVLQDALMQASGLLIASPEYNSGYTALLKNSIDWTSRPHAGRGTIAAYLGKTAGLVAASPSPLGGMRGIFNFREVLLNIDVTVLPTTAFVGGVRPESFAADGSLVDAKLQARVQAVGAAVARQIAKK